VDLSKLRFHKCLNLSLVSRHADNRAECRATSSSPRDKVLLKNLALGRPGGAALDYLGSSQCPKSATFRQEAKVESLNYSKYNSV